MSGQYNGLQAHLKEDDNPDLQHEHCVAHVLNLVMTDSTECCKIAKDFLGLLQTTANFISESHKRMQVWTKVNRRCTSGAQLLRRLQKINTTRWWSKDRALNSVFDDFSTPMQDRKKFLALLQCLIHIAYFGDFKAEVTFKAKCLLENWCKFQNIFLASIFTELCRVRWTALASEYLQKREVD